MSPNDGQLRLSAVRVFVEDLAKAKKFYGDLLGLKLLSQDLDYMVFESGDVTLILEVPNLLDDEESDLVGRFTGVSFETLDVEGLYQRLKKSKVKFACPPEEQPWGGTLATCYDPSGNGITFVQYNKAKKSKTSASVSSGKGKPKSTDPFDQGMDTLFALDSVEQKISDLEHRAAALAELSSDAKDKQFKKAQSAAAVEKDLEAIKKRVKELKADAKTIGGKPRLVVDSKDSQSDKKKKLLPAVISKKTNLPATTKKK